MEKTPKKEKGFFTCNECLFRYFDRIENLNFKQRPECAFPIVEFCPVCGNKI